jgi:hypothetical protein
MNNIALLIEVRHPIELGLSVLSKPNSRFRVENAGSGKFEVRASTLGYIESPGNEK